MNTKRNILLLMMLLITTGMTYAQRQNIQLRTTDKKPFITYENRTASICFEERSFTKAFNATPKTAQEQSLFEEAVKQAKASKSTMVIPANNLGTAEKWQRVLARIINDQLGVGLLLKGSASVLNKETGKAVTTIEYEKTAILIHNANGVAHKFYFLNENYPFFEKEGYEGNVVATASMSAEESSMNVEASPDYDQPVEVMAEVEPVNDENTVYTVVEQPAEYPGGMEQMQTYLSKNMKRPAGCEGTVYVRFIITTDGAITNPDVVKGLGSECDNEALRLVKAMPAWKPARQNGKPVKNQFILPIKFKAQ